MQLGRRATFVVPGTTFHSILLPGIFTFVMLLSMYILQYCIYTLIITVDFSEFINFT